MTDAALLAALALPDSALTEVAIIRPPYSQFHYQRGTDASTWRIVARAQVARIAGRLVRAGERWTLRKPNAGV